MSSQYCMQLEMITDENIYGTVTNHHKKGTAIEKKRTRNDRCNELGL